MKNSGTFIALNISMITAINNWVGINTLHLISQLKSRFGYDYIILKQTVYNIALF